jgi:tetratricopeptide (TPR) repeat protein
LSHHSGRVIAVLLVVVLLAAAVGALILLGSGEKREAPDVAPLTPVPATYVGRQACVRCHEYETRQFEGSHHDLAMDVATEQTVLGDFTDVTITQFGVTTRFLRDGGRFLVNTEGADGQHRDFEVTHVFGVTPLQQYLVPFPGGRYQVLPLCWDTRPATDGGQRWFHIYPNERIAPGDELHWAGRNQNWNWMCAECHSTDLKRGYDPTTDTYETTWSEIDVSCEACHGPGSAHVAWAEGGGTGSEAGHRMAPLEGRDQINLCARCHARRGTANEEWIHGRPFLDTHRPRLLLEPQYFADGQILDEVYVYGSFLQSRMYHEGVTCTDCHDPHSMNRYAPGNALCNRCHEPGKYDTIQHHFHEKAGEGTLCTQCHMPERKYMVIDPRADHSLRVPRPDLSVAIGTPNACNGCHDDKTARWSADQVEKWYGPGRRKEWHYGEALHAGARGLPAGLSLLTRLAGDSKQPAIARASALVLLAAYPVPKPHTVVRNALGDEEAMVRAAALRALNAVPDEARVDAAGPLLTDRVMLVRAAAARALNRVPPDRLPERFRAAFDRAFAEMVAAEMSAGERAFSRMNLGTIYLERGRTAEAEAEFRAALDREPEFYPAAVNLADLYREQGRDKEGERVLAEAIRAAPRAAAPYLSVGLLLVRGKRYDAATRAFRRAMELDPGNARYHYTYALSLESVNRRDEAYAEMKRARARFSRNLDILGTLISMAYERRIREDVTTFVQDLAELAKDDPRAMQLLQSLNRR